MSNEEYLITSYFVVGAFSIVVASLTYLWLRPTIHDLSQKLSGKYLSRILKKTLPLSLFFPALLGFCSVTFRSCSKDTYKEIIADRAYLVAKNQEQLSMTLFYVSVGVIILGLFVFGVLIVNDYRYRNNGG